MTKHEKALILFSLSALADNLGIKENELISTDKQNIKFNKVLEENKGIFNNDNVLKNDLIDMFDKYLNKLIKLK